MDVKTWTVNQLTARLLSGPWAHGEIAAAIEEMLGPAPLSTREILVAGVLELGEGRYPPAPHHLAAYLRHSPFFKPRKNQPVAAVLEAPRFAPSPPFADLPIPALETPGALAEWLGLTAEKLDFLADQRRQHRRAEKPALRHYRYARIAKAGGQTRLLEAPKPRLKAIQRRILHEILGKIPVHASAHGFVSGRSCLTGAQIHAGEAMVASFDLVQFFPSITLPRIHGLFRALGYPWAVARRLAGLCTTITPAGLQAADMYSAPHLPQGAPTSPALANLLAWTLDKRLYGLARAAGANYTRYADDLAFSGDATRIARLGKSVAAIVSEEGFALNPAKTRIMPRKGRQRITGITVNAHCNTGRAEFDALKATLHNCTRTGPAAQNRHAHPDFRRHLEGRLAWVEQINPARGEKLRQIFERIDWGGAAIS
jgi:retron-type reverse transcriptase